MQIVIFAQSVEKGSVTHKLFTGEKQLQAWADELEKTQPQTLEEAWDAMDVLLRAERDEAVLRLIPHLDELICTSNYRGDSTMRSSHNRIADTLWHLPPEHK
jgi:hypothetical protein